MKTVDLTLQVGLVVGEVGTTLYSAHPVPYLEGEVMEIRIVVPKEFVAGVFSSGKHVQAQLTVLD